MAGVVVFSRPVLLSIIVYNLKVSSSKSATTHSGNVSGNPKDTTVQPKQLYRELLHREKIKLSFQL